MSSATVDVPKTYAAWRLRIFGITWLAYASYYLVRKPFSIAKVAIVNDPRITLSKFQMAEIDTAYQIAYCLGQFVWGPLGDRLGTRRIVIVGLSVAIVAAGMSGLSSALSMFVVFAVIQGAAQSTGWSPLIKNMSWWFSFRERGTIMGVWCTNYAIGGLVAGILAGSAIWFFQEKTSIGPEFGAWRFGFFVPAVIVLGVLVSFVFLQRNRPEDVGLPSIEEFHGEKEQVIEAGDRVEDEPEQSWSVVAEVLRNPIVWTLAVGYFSLKLTRYAFLFWGPLYVNNTLGSGVAESAWISAMFELGGPLGVFVLGWASDRIFRGKRMPVVVISLFVLAMVLLVGSSMELGRFGMATFFFASGFFLFGPDALVSGTAAMDFGTKRAAGTAAGMINGVGSFGAILGGLLPGWLDTNTESAFGQRLGGSLRELLPGRTDWQILFYIFVVAIFLTMALFLPLWNRRPPVAK